MHTKKALHTFKTSPTSPIAQFCLLAQELMQVIENNKVNVYYVNQFIFGFKVLCFIALTLSILLRPIPLVLAQDIDFQRLANAIYKAEGGSKTRHPYGILVRYKHTSPRQACLNTLRHKYRIWAKTRPTSDYLSYLASQYAPLNSDTDNGTNRYWLKNVTYFYNQTGGRL